MCSEGMAAFERFYLTCAFRAYIVSTDDIIDSIDELAARLPGIAYRRPACLIRAGGDDGRLNLLANGPNEGVVGDTDGDTRRMAPDPDRTVGTGGNNPGDGMAALPRQSVGLFGA